MFPSQAPADSLYRWTDSQGRVHFGDRPPPSDPAHVEQMKMPAFSQPERSPEDDPYSILNQLDRLQTNRQNLERERRERAWREREYYLRKRELDALEQAAESSDSSTVRGYAWPVYPRHPSHRPGRPGRPGYRPGWPDQRAPSRIDRWYMPDHPAYSGHPHPRPHPRPVAPRLPGRGASVTLRR